jgi:hypothetical protein
MVITSPVMSTISIFSVQPKDAAQIALHDFAEILDKHQKLTIQERKTEILDINDFQQRAESYLVDRPLNDQETEILRIIRKHTDDDQNPYESIALEDIDEEDWQIVNSDSIGDLIGLYLGANPVNYPRLGWLLRRLSQVGAPAALPKILASFRELVPVLGDVAKYIVRASENVENLPDVGEAVLWSLSIPLVQRSEYLRIVLLNLFSQIPSLDHINHLTQGYNSATPAVRRELMLAAWRAKAGHWIKERKSDFETSDV